LCREIDDRLGGTTLFINGAQGGMVTADIRHPDGEHETWDECERIGRTLAGEVLRILAAAQVQADPALHCAWQVLRFPVKAPMAALFQMADTAVRMELDGEDCLAVPQHLVQIGSARLLTVPGEALPNIGCFLKRKLDSPFPFLLGLANDALGYMLSRADYDSFPVYEYISATCLGEETGEILMDRSLELIAEMDARLAPQGAA
ncbi:MAG: hypothetical protein IT368_02425, partial [Candidatus Hydrogenedentes bacterium]|nr:hypothetical protein [Candidatus Hydrogenedentota bacterium]